MKKFKLIDNENIIKQTCLYNTKPIILNPELALIFGDSDMALIFQQIHYWIGINKQNAEMGLANINTYHQNRFWCFQTYEQWEQQFIWMDKRTIRRKIKKLEELGVVLSDNFNQLNLDRTKWYTINYSKLLECQKNILNKKLQELKLKMKKRTEKEKKSNQKFKENKKNNVENSVDNSFKKCSNCHYSRNGQNVHFLNGQDVHIEMDNLSIPIQETNKQKNNYQENKVCLSVNKDIKENNNDRLTDTENFKIENEDNNELNNFVVEVVNKLLQQKTTKIKNKNIYINQVINELKKLDKYEIEKLINYVSSKFINNKDVVKNEVAYIKSIFINAIFEKRYNFEKPKENSTNNYNKFCDYKQREYNPELIKRIEQKDIGENEDIKNGLYDDCETLEEFQERYKELHGIVEIVEEENINVIDEDYMPF